MYNLLWENTLLGNVERFVPIKALCLEAGSGSGRVVFEVAQLSSFVVGVDFSTIACKIAKKNCRSFNCDFVVADIRNLPLKNDIFDYTMSLGVIEHFKKPQILLREMRRTLKRGGTLFLETPNRKMFLLTKSMMEQATKKWGYHDVYSPQELKKLVYKCDLSVVTSFTLDFSFGVITWYSTASRLASIKSIKKINQLVKILLRILTIPFNAIFPSRGFYSVVIATKQ